MSCSRVTVNSRAVSKGTRISIPQCVGIILLHTCTYIMRPWPAAAGGCIGRTERT